MSIDELYDLTPRELYNAVQGHQQLMRQQFDHTTQTIWEATRWSTATLLQPHSKRTVQPHHLIKFPWEKDHVKKTNRKPFTKEEAMSIKQRYERLAQKEAENA
jgi:hypothetical protein